MLFRTKSNDIKVNGELNENVYDDDENLSDSDDFFETPKPPVNEQVKKGRMLLKR